MADDNSCESNKAKLWDSVENSRKSRNDENYYIASLAASLPLCHKSGDDGPRFIGIDAPKKLPTLRYAVSYALKETLLTNILGIEKNKGCDNENRINEHLSSLRSDYDDELLLVFDPSNFYLDQSDQKSIGRGRNRLRNREFLSEHAGDLLESGKLVYISENCERFFSLQVPSMLAKYESIYELMSTSEAERLAQFVETILPLKQQEDRQHLCIFSDGLASEGKFSFNGFSLPVMATLRVLRGEKAENDSKLVVSMRCRELISANASSFSFRCNHDLTIEEALMSSQNSAADVGDQEESSIFLSIFKNSEEMRGENWLKIVHPDYLAHTIKGLKMLIETKTPLALTTRLISNDGNKSLFVQAFLSSENDFTTITCRPLPEEAELISELRKVGEFIFKDRANFQRTPQTGQKVAVSEESFVMPPEPKRFRESSEHTAGFYQQPEFFTAPSYNNYYYQQDPQLLINQNNNNDNSSLYEAAQQQQQQQYLIFNVNPSAANVASSTAGFYQQAASGTFFPVIVNQTNFFHLMAATPSPVEECWPSLASYQQHQHQYLPPLASSADPTNNFLSNTVTFPPLPPISSSSAEAVSQHQNQNTIAQDLQNNGKTYALL